MRPFPTSPRRPRLSVEPLEGRVVPAGTVTVSLSPLGVLTINGDDFDNQVTLKVTGTDIAITPQGTTQLKGTVPATGAVKSVVVNLKGGADSLAIDGLAAFTVPGAVTISLGDGDNTLDLVTTGKIQVGALTVRGGDGLDTVRVKGGAAAGSQVTGPATFTYGTGGSSTTLGNVTFKSAVMLTAGDAGGRPNELLADTVTVVGPVTASLNNSKAPTVSFTNSTIGPLTETGYVAGALLESTTVKGNVVIRATYQGDLQADGATITGSALLAAALPSVEATGAGTTINGNLVATGTGWTNTLFATDTLSEVKGAVTVVGGWSDDRFSANSNFKVGKTVSLTLNGGDNTVTIGGKDAAVSIGGGLIVKAAAGADVVALDRVSVGGPVTIALGAGNDTLTIENGSTFLKTFAADLGTGDDTITIAQNTKANGSPGPTTFTGLARILGGAGNDTLALGLAGDASSKAVFTAGLLNVVDGGLGLDFFDAAAANFVGVTPTGWAP